MIVTFSIFNDDGYLDDVTASLKNIWKYTTKMYLLSLRLFTRISVSFVAFFGFDLCNSLIMSSFSNTEKKNW